MNYNGGIEFIIYLNKGVVQMRHTYSLNNMDNLDFDDLIDLLESENYYLDELTTRKL